MITDDEFRCRLELRLDLNEELLEKVWKAVADIRSIEREMISRSQMYTRSDIHPICYCETKTNTLPQNTTVW